MNTNELRNEDVIDSRTAAIVRAASWCCDRFRRADRDFARAVAQARADHSDAIERAKADLSRVLQVAWKCRMSDVIRCLGPSTGPESDDFDRQSVHAEKPTRPRVIDEAETACTSARARARLRYVDPDSLYLQAVAAATKAHDMQFAEIEVVRDTAIAKADTKRADEQAGAWKTLCITIRRELEGAIQWARTDQTEQEET